MKKLFEMSKNIEIYIKPPKRVFLLNLRELWRYKELFLVLAWRDISIRYKQTALGVIWALFQPVITMVVFTLIFNRMANIQSGDQTPYPIFLYVGLLLWQYFSNTVTNASNSLVLNASMIQKVYFPRLILPTTAATTGLVDFAISTLVLAAMMVFYGFAPSLLGLTIFPMLFISTACCALGFGFFLSALNVKYRDVRYALPFFIQLLMYVSPVIYPVSMLDRYPKIKAAMFFLNPISGIISNARAGLLSQGEVDFGLIWMSLLMSMVYFILGLLYFRNTERYFADTV